MGRNPPKYRALLPAAPHGDQALPLSTSALDPVPKRKATRIACNECHEKKRKDELETLRGRYEVLDLLVTKLRVAPHACAQEALRQLRSSPTNWSADLEAPAQQTKVPSSMSTANGLNSPLSEPDRASCIPPLYACGPAQDLGSSAEEPYPMALAETVQGDCCDQPHLTLDEGSASPPAASLGPIKIASDPRLKGLDIAFWTAVPVTDVFAKDAISSYLRSDHRIWELFDADSFLSDLVAQKSNFCSAFLVNCLLAFASQTYANDCPSATSKGVEFEVAAGILWQLEDTRLDSETALTGLILLYLCLAARWKSNNADDCLGQVLETAIRMKLFGVEERISDFDMSLLKADRRSSMVHAAWGAFNTMSTHKRRMLGDVTSLPPLVSTPRMISASTLSENDDLPTDC
ncbi:hypothetical protein INS49_009631 [Diaporthe citri]|uniref:uncharacterized protein n=1 Tax=Diaporthe citri TaxID=83186 RepID=UPI001C802B61|nr:uncharacterized protein INS49_009631 [Diaporthe citri]KAG6361404.1 hypothetical protein INS49_009631 [Diaporthe citri]